MAEQTPFNLYSEAPAFGPLGPISVKAFTRKDLQYFAQRNTTQASADVSTGASGSAVSEGLDLSGIIEAIQGLAAAVDAINQRLDGASIDAQCTGDNVTVTLNL